MAWIAAASAGVARRIFTEGFLGIQVACKNMILSACFKTPVGCIAFMGPIKEAYYGKNTNQYEFREAFLGSRQLNKDRYTTACFMKNCHLFLLAEVKTGPCATISPFLFPSLRFMKKWLLPLTVIFLVHLLAAGIWLRHNLRDRFPDSEIDLHIPSGEAGLLSAGFAKTDISPDLPDSWVDANNDARFEEKDGDTWTDGNGNGQFDASWIAGFHKHRPAAGIHDPLWARAMVLDDGKTRIALVVLDAIGFGHDDVLRVRERISPDLDLDYVTVISTHTHQGPDLIGLWGPGNFSSGVDPAYLEKVIAGAAATVEQAVAALQPARLQIAQDLEGATPLVGDTRKPHVLDPGLRLIQAIDAQADTTLGTLLAWSNHPETLWSRNVLISSDFPHYFREAMEKGVYRGDSLLAPGLGGIAVYLNGSIGGLMTTHPSMAIDDPLADTAYLEPSYDKIRAQGDQLALLSLAALDRSTELLETGSIALRAKTLHLPLGNKLFQIAAALGVLNRGMPKWMTMRTEIAAWTLGPISVMQVPGEIYPEIVNGGIEAPEGEDFATAPLEIPPLRSQMPGKYQFVIGLANDLIGYIIPRSEWDEKAPFLYGENDSPYGEINSVGPETAPLIHGEMLKLWEELGE